MNRPNSQPESKDEKLSYSNVIRSLIEKQRPRETTTEAPRNINIENNIFNKVRVSSNEDRKVVTSNTAANVADNTGTGIDLDALALSTSTAAPYVDEALVPFQGVGVCRAQIPQICPPVTVATDDTHCACSPFFSDDCSIFCGHWDPQMDNFGGYNAVMTWFRGEEDCMVGDKAELRLKMAWRPAASGGSEFLGPNGFLPPWGDGFWLGNSPRAYRGIRFDVVRNPRRAAPLYLMEVLYSTFMDHFVDPQGSKASSCYTLFQYEIYSEKSLVNGEYLYNWRGRQHDPSRSGARYVMRSGANGAADGMFHTPPEQPHIQVSYMCKYGGDVMVAYFGYPYRNSPLEIVQYADDQKWEMLEARCYMADMKHVYVYTTAGSKGYYDNYPMIEPVQLRNTNPNVDDPSHPGFSKANRELWDQWTTQDHLTDRFPILEQVTDEGNGVKEMGEFQAPCHSFVDPFVRERTMGPGSEKSSFSQNFQIKKCPGCLNPQAAPNNGEKYVDPVDGREKYHIIGMSVVDNYGNCPQEQFPENIEGRSAESMNAKAGSILVNNDLNTQTDFMKNSRTTLYGRDYLSTVMSRNSLVQLNDTTKVQEKTAQTPKLPVLGIWNQGTSCEEGNHVAEFQVGPALAAPTSTDSDLMSSSDGESWPPSQAAKTAQANACYALNVSDGSGDFGNANVQDFRAVEFRCSELHFLELHFFQDLSCDDDGTYILPVRDWQDENSPGGGNLYTYANSCHEQLDIESTTYYMMKQNFFLPEC